MLRHIHTNYFVDVTVVRLFHTHERAQISSIVRISVGREARGINLVSHDCCRGYQLLIVYVTCNAHGW